MGVLANPLNHLSQCRMESLYTPIYPEVTTKILNFRSEVLEELRDDFSNRIEDSPDFWKIRIITHLAVSPLFYSVTFIPFDLTASQTWFVQKTDVGPALKGFYAPFLTEEQREDLGCIDKPDQFTIIENLQDIHSSISTLENEIYLDTFILLNYFLMDQLTAMVGFTSLDQHGNHTSRFWCKGLVFKNATLLKGKKFY